MNKKLLDAMKSEQPLQVVGTINAYSSLLANNEEYALIVPTTWSGCSLFIASNNFLFINFPLKIYSIFNYKIFTTMRPFMFPSIKASNACGKASKVIASEAIISNF